MKKSELVESVQEALDNGTALGIVLMLHMPGGETEVIQNPNVAGKLKDIQDAYDDDLVHCDNKEIWIEDFGLAHVGDTMDFGTALLNMKSGSRISRKGWNGKGMYVFLAGNIEFHTAADLSEFNEADAHVSDLMVLRTAQGTLQPGWLATQSDILAEDWYVVTD